MTETTKKKWSKVEPGVDRVLVDGEPYSVKKAKTTGKETKAILIGEGGRFLSRTFTGKVELDEYKKKKATGAPWSEKPKVEERVESILGAQLLGVEEGGLLYVPPVDETTIEAHVRVMHGSWYLEATSIESLLEMHAADHKSAEEKPFHELKHPHTHTKRRPS
jgi:hypothetical protein